ncbi:BTB/POZ domain-containing protein At3g09030 isoform X2 [Phalaenopsis equestris]|uniref:BTB/POZ domain-containing protein At3g09030 isoform X1 n=1 Tax=Phalaenopsis equestris TaxID=78828 RepID=UPI0009E3613B|nr:BTB/POZ domain-containing protein At3g09030 isoform X1 [Phalaenopsis equestris]XP_020576575.1 BTB/POZ domain-containing protein At3g09030 isoform X2 [Phalaenopsis equestris]
MADSSGGILEPVLQPTESHRIKLNVGGKQFETTASTLQVGGHDSLLAALSARHTTESDEHEPIFIDRDPEIFSALLSLLRSGRLPSAALRRFSKQDLADEALYYGIEGRLRLALSPPPLLGINATLLTTLIPAAEAHPTALYAGFDDGSIWIAHGGQISSYDSNLIHSGTVRTHLEDIASLRCVWPDIAAIGSLETPGLHLYDVSSGRQIASVNWSDPSDPRVYKARVTAIAATEPGCNSRRPVFAAFECPHRENCILSVDRSTLQIVSEIGRLSGSGSKTSSPGKLVDLTEVGGGVVFASAVSSGAFGYSGYMRLWDPRTGKAVWETSEPGSGARSGRFGDAFSDVDVDRKEMSIYKVCWKSGDLAVADIRKLSEDPWLYLEERSAALRIAGGGANSIVNCYNGQVFVSRESGLEVWSRVEEDGEEREGRAERKKIWRRNFVDKEDDAKRGLIRGIEVGGDRLFVCRTGVEGVEVWESSDFSGSISLS